MQDSYIFNDQESLVIYDECINVLISAGFHKARIKSLEIFDRIVGGMLWCLSATDAGIDIDLLFLENLNIKDKISVTEKVLSALKLLKCPYHLEPHQIQGYDLENIYPVLKWLVTKTKAQRELYEKYYKSCASHNYERYFVSFSSLDTCKIKDTKFNLSVEPNPYKNLSPEEILKLIEDRFVDVSIKNNESKSKLLNEAQKGELIDDSIKSKTSKSIIEMDKKVSSMRKNKEQKQEARLNKFRESLTILQNDIINLEIEIKKSEDAFEEKKKEHEILRKEVLSDETISKSFYENVDKYTTLKEKRNESRKIYKDTLNKLEKNLKSLSEKYNIEVNQRDSQKIQLNDEYVEILKDKKLTLKKRIAQEAIVLKEKQTIIANYQQMIDDIPKRNELNIFQKNLLELYKKANSLHLEVEESYLTQNSLNDISSILNKQNEVIESIITCFHTATTSVNKQLEFIKNLEKIKASLSVSHEKIKSLYENSTNQYLQANEVLQKIISKKEEYSKLFNDFKKKIHPEK